MWEIEKDHSKLNLSSGMKELYTKKVWEGRHLWSDHTYHLAIKKKEISHEVIIRAHQREESPHGHLVAPHTLTRVKSSISHLAVLEEIKLLLFYHSTSTLIQHLRQTMSLKYLSWIKLWGKRSKDSLNPEIMKLKKTAYIKILSKTTKPLVTCSIKSWFLIARHIYKITLKLPSL